MAKYDYLEETCEQRYEALKEGRSAVETRAESSAKLTIPSVFPKEDDNDTSTLDDVYQSLGARAVLNLSSKFMQILLPSNQTFFKLMPSKELEEQILSGENPTMLDELTAGLVKLETGIQHEVDRQSIRNPVHEAMKLNIVTGNALLWKDPKGLSVFSIRDYVVQRDSSGNILDMIVVERVSPRTLDDSIKLVDPTIKVVKVYTRIVHDGEGNYQMYQEIEDKVVTGSEKTFKEEDTLPFIVLRWTALPNSNYGRGLVEHYIGDLRNYEAINMVITDIASVMSRIVFMVNPNTQHGTDVQDLNDAVSGDFIAGHADDITVPQTDKQADLSALLQYMQGLEQRLSQAFLLFTSRDAERVTAQEIRRVSQQLEETLGGVYSLLSDEFQKPLLKLFMEEMNIDVGQEIEAVITSGLDALGRGTDANKLIQFMEGLNLIPEGWAEVNQSTLVQRLAYASGMDVDNLIKSGEQKQEEAQSASQSQMEQTFGDSLAQEGGKQAVQQQQI